MRPIVNTPPAVELGSAAAAAGRVGAGIAGLALSAGALWSALVVLIFGGSAGKQPDAAVIDGDPCCPTPDGWSDVVAWTAGTALLSALVALALTLGASLLCFSARGRWLAPWSLVIVPGAAAVLVCVAIAIAQTAQALA